MQPQRTDQLPLIVYVRATVRASHPTILVTAVQSLMTTMLSSCVAVMWACRVQMKVQTVPLTCHLLPGSRYLVYVGLL